MKLIWFLIFMLPLFCMNCTNSGSTSEKPENLIAEETYIDLLVEFQLIKAQSAVSRSLEMYPDSAKQLIYEKYDVSEEQFLQSNEYYQQQVASQIKRINRVIEELEEAQALFRSHVDSLQADTLSVDSLKNNATPDSAEIDSITTDSLKSDNKPH